MALSNTIANRTITRILFFITHCQKNNGQVFFFLNKLTNLIGSPKIVKECFACAYCDNLKSLEGISGIIKGGISCTNCKSLRDITHIKKVGDNIIIQNCPNITKSTPEIDKKIRIYNEG